MYIPRFVENTSKIVILSGSGLSAPSGIKTFRGDNWLWNWEKISEVCNINSWKENFEKVHNFYNHLRNIIKKATPNKAHKEIVKLVKKYWLFPKDKDGCVIPITQNIDNLLEKAGLDEVMHVHGKIWEMQCQDCGKIFEWGWEDFIPYKDTCPACKSKWVKPAVVFFGESAPMYTYMKRAFEFLNDPKSLFLVIGTSGKVININNLLDTTCKKILCNLAPSPYIDHTKFDKVYFDSIDNIIDKVVEDIYTCWE